MYYKHVDVFSKIPLSGNSLSVFILSEMLPTTKMQKIAEEMRHFESIFLYPIANREHEYQARIFTVDEELDFAGHPLIGAACAIHDEYHKDKENIVTKFKLNTRELEITSNKNPTYYSATMNQGIPEFISRVPSDLRNEVIKNFNLSLSNLADLPFEVVSTGLSYLIIPLKSGLELVQHKNITPILSQYKAKFAYFYDISRQEGRTWDNNGNVEDVATGSAVGPVGAYLVKHNLAKLNETIIIHQGRFLGRPSELKVMISNTKDNITKVEVSGDSYIVGSGNILNDYYNL